MCASDHSLGAAAIIENLLKHQWSRTILRHIRKGTCNPVEISRVEMWIAPSTMSERLRTMVRYNLITRRNESTRPKQVTYRLTPKGRRVLSLLDVIGQLDDVPEHDPRPLEEIFDPHFRVLSGAPLVLADREHPPSPAVDNHRAAPSAHLA